MYVCMYICEKWECHLKNIFDWCQHQFGLSGKMKQKRNTTLIAFGFFRFSQSKDVTCQFISLFLIEMWHIRKTAATAKAPTSSNIIMRQWCIAFEMYSIIICLHRCQSTQWDSHFSKRSVGSFHGHENLCNTETTYVTRITLAI